MVNGVTEGVDLGTKRGKVLTKAIKYYYESASFVTVGSIYLSNSNFKSECYGTSYT